MRFFTQAEPDEVVELDVEF